MQNKNYYDVLGINKNASEDEIKKAYRSLAKRYHPDVCKEKDAEEKFKEIQKAYDVLSDPNKKANYDRFGTDEVNPNMGGGFDPFGGFNPFGGFGRSREIKEQGEDIKINVTMTFDEIFTGLHKKIKLKKKSTCPRCHGTGSSTNETTTCPVCNGTGMKTEIKHTPFGVQQIMTTCNNCHGTGKVIKDPCPMCNGTGLFEKDTDIEFNIPAGMPNNSYFVLNGKGHDGPHNGIPGDLIVIVKELPNDKKLYRDDNNNMWYDLNLKITDLIYGADVDVPYINNSFKKLHIEPGTQPGKVMTLYGQGFANPNNNTIKADYKINVNCIIPNINTISSDDKKEFDKLKERGNY